MTDVVRMEEALSEGGFEAALAASDEEAITLLEADKSSFRGVVTDINLLGKLDGWAVGRTAREFDPTIPVIYMTGTHGEEVGIQGRSQQRFCSQNPLRRRRS